MNIRDAVAVCMNLEFQVGEDLVFEGQQDLIDYNRNCRGCTYDPENNKNCPSYRCYRRDVDENQLR